MRCRNYGLARRGGPAVLDVVEDAVVEEDGVLRDDGDGGTQAVLRQLAQVDAVDHDAAGADVVEAVEQARQR